MPDLRTFRPGGARVVAYGVGVLMVVLTIVIGLALPDEIYFTPAEDVTLWLIIAPRNSSATANCCAGSSAAILDACGSCAIRPQRGL